MSETINIPLSNLVIDTENPRLSKPNVGQREAMRELAEDQQSKLLKLAEHIVDFGQNLSELPIVMATEDKLRYIVLEGNRRLTAIRALENPDFLSGAVFPSVLNGFRKLSPRYEENPIEEINCLLVKDREEARPWIELRHTGENEGAGIVRWDADESGRYRARTRSLEPHLQALEWLGKRGLLSEQTRKDVPTASLRRVLSTPVVREKLGIDIKKRTLHILGNESKVAKALMWVVNELASGRTKTENIYKKEDREEFAGRIPSPVSPTLPSAKPVAQKTARRAVAKPARPRDKLIPRDCVLNVSDPRIKQIEQELRALSIDSYTNAVSVLFRVFVELSCDDFISRNRIATNDMTKLGTKLSLVAEDLKNHKKLTAQQVKPVRRAATKDSFLAPSITLMHGYVHNQYIFPAPGDLRAYWDSLQPFLVAIWVT